MSGKPKNKVPKEKIPVEDEVPLEADEDLFIEETVTVDEKSKTPGKKDVAPESKKKKKNGFRLSSIDPIILVSFSVFLIACLIVTGVTVYGIVSGENNESTAQYGDSVTVDYTGSYFAYYDENGVVFDTSYSSIGKSSDYKKSYEFNSDKSYDSLTFSIGDGKYLSDFENALIGHKPGDTVKVKIKDGYGSLDSTNRFVESRTGIVIEKNINLTADAYKKLFGVDSVPSVGISTVKSPYGWDAQVSSNSNGTVNIEYIPVENQEYDVCDGLKTKATTVGANITFEYIFGNQKFDENTNMLKAVMNGSIVYIIAYDGDNTMTYKTTEEKTGIDLYFVIKFVEYSS